MQNARINVRRLAKRLLLSLVLPVLIAGIIDMTVGTYPWLIIAASVVCLPRSSSFGRPWPNWIRSFVESRRNRCPNKRQSQSQGQQRGSPATKRRK
jgi:hypothetical protein